MKEQTSQNCLGRSPLGDPAAYALCGAAIALRDRDSSKIEVEAREWSGS